MQYRIIKTLLSFLVIALLTPFAYAVTIPMPGNGNTVIGNFQDARIGWGDTFTKLSRRYDMGFDALADANDTYTSSGQLPLFYHVLIPSVFILPDTPYNGIVVNVAEKRLFYYDQQNDTIMTFPVGVGKEGWSTPLGVMTIIDKIVNPTWTPPKDILVALASEGYTNVPTSIPPGPQDPLGAFALRLSNPSYLIHGTNDPDSIGTEASSGCIRLYPEDISQLFQAVPQGTQVRIINQRYVLGWYNNQIYMAVYPGLEGTAPLNIDKVEKAIMHRTKDLHARINWRKVAYMVLDQDGIPQPIGSVGA